MRLLISGKVRPNEAPYMRKMISHFIYHNLPIADPTGSVGYVVHDDGRFEVWGTKRAYRYGDGVAIRVHEFHMNLVPDNAKRKIKS